MTLVLPPDAPAREAYAAWVRRFLAFHNYRDPAALGAPEVQAYLTHLAVRQKVSASTQNQAFNALLFLFREVLERKLAGLEETPRAKGPERLPLVLHATRSMRCSAASADASG